jgi:hypothetical protein
MLKIRIKILMSITKLHNRRVQIFNKIIDKIEMEIIINTLMRGETRTGAAKSAILMEFK